MYEFKDKLEGIYDSFIWAISEKEERGEDTEIEKKCLDEIELVLKYVKRFERGLL